MENLKIQLEWLKKQKRLASSENLPTMLSRIEREIAEKEQQISQYKNKKTQCDNCDEGTYWSFEYGEYSTCTHNGFNP